MIPLRDDAPRRGVAYLTLALIGANLATWATVQGFGRDPALSESVCRFGAFPAALSGAIAPGATVALGAGDASCRLVEEAAWLGALTSMFLHGGWFHLLGNLWFLFVFGDNVESRLGRRRFLALYLAAGLCAVAAQVASSPTSAVPMVGASGAIGGVMGAYLVLFPRARVHVLLILVVFVTRVVVPAWVMLGYWFVLQVLGGAVAPSGTGGVAFWAHVGGFATGFALVPIFRVARSTSRFFSPK